MEKINYLPNGFAYRVRGEGPDVMLLHGFGEDGTIWNQQAAVLERKFRLIIPDLPGTGLSKDSFEKITDRSLESLADVVREIADQEDLDQFVMLGHSMGGYITLAFAENFPHRLTGFGLIHSTAYPDSEEKKQNRQKSIEFIGKHGSKLFLEQTIPNLYSEEFREKQREVVAEHVKTAVFEPQVLIAYYEMMMQRPDRVHVLKDAQIPVLFVMGTEDKTVNLADGLAQSHLPVESHVHILRASGHMGMKEEPEKMAEAIEGFLLHLNEN